MIIHRKRNAVVAHSAVDAHSKADTFFSHREGDAVVAHSEGDDVVANSEGPPTAVFEVAVVANSAGDT